MSVIFADTGYWIALIDPRDKWHHKAVTLSKALSGSLLVTTNEVLAEVLTFFSSYGSRMRKSVAQIVFGALTNQAYIEVVEQSRASFLSGLALYEKPTRQDL